MRKDITRKTREAIEAYVMLLPTIIGFLLISAGPILIAILLGFTDAKFKWPPNWIGIRNYQLLFSNPLFPKIILNSLYYSVLTVVPSAVFSFLLALLVNNKVKGIAIFRAAYFWPVVASMAAVSVIWKFMLNPQIGLMNYALQYIGIKGPIWLGTTQWVIPSLALTFVWKWVGFYMIILLAGMQDIPEDLYEASIIDGANGFQKILHITFPMVSPTLFFVIVISTIASFQLFDQVMIMTNDAGPAYSALTLSYYVYQNAFQWGKMGYACSIGVILFVIVFLFSSFQMRLQNKWVFYR